QTRPDQTRPHLYSFIADWLDSEGLFIFWMIVLNCLYCGLPLEFFKREAFYFLKGIGIFLRDVSVVFLTVLILDLLLYLILRKFPAIIRTVKVVFLTVSACMFAVDAFAIYYFKAPINNVMLDTILMTNFREGTEFLKMYLLSPDLWLLCISVIVLLILCRYLFAVICRRKVLLLILLVAGASAGIASEYRDFKRDNMRSMRSIALTRLSSMFYKKYEINLAWQKVLQGASKDIRLTKNDSGIPYVVFVLGESTGRKHMGIYGYHLPTTPNFTRLKAEGRLYAFDDVISPNGLTHLSLQKIFTFYSNGDLGKWFEYTSLFRILKEAGYYSVWLSNQERRIGGEVTFLFSEQCSSSIFIEKFREDFTNAIPYDEKVLPLLDESLKSEHAKNFYVIHLMGTHGRYNERYPAEYTKFKPEQEEGSSEAAKTAQAYYDNAILYNDFIVSEIISRFQDRNAIVIYISDHGEDVFDGGSILGHSEGTNDRYVLEIPMIIWLSQKFSDSFPELERRISDSIHRPYMTDDIIHTLLDLTGVHTDEYDPRKSIINPQFDASRPRTHAGRFLYDKESGLRAIR
ncbi:MAG: sulfatase-like hydrolase/transferase, partial [Synergistaceae bacterium]|nr:sulfatase-like hydrolase/transferase [Synergistaceae bacterium]